jgi:hypothetical protein
MGVGSVALWRLGSEDPASGPRCKLAQGAQDLPRSRHCPKTNVDVEGNGEILRIDPRRRRAPNAGFRRASPITGERYDALPTPYVVRRTGAGPSWSR